MPIVYSLGNISPAQGFDWIFQLLVLIREAIFFLALQYRKTNFLIVRIRGGTK